MKVNTLALVEALQSELEALRSRCDGVPDTREHFICMNAILNDLIWQAMPKNKFPAA
jgi:hypothetical protein